MLNCNKKGIVHLVLNPIILLILAVVIIGIIFIIKPSGLNLSILSSTESQLRSEYTTIWGDSNDLNIHTSIAGNQRGGENNDFRWSAWIDTNGELVLHPPRTAIANFHIKHNFYGQEFVVYFRGAGGKLAIGNNAFARSQNENYILIVKPHTLNLNKVDIYEVGQLVKTLDVSNPLLINFEASNNDAVYVDFVGYKTQFECDLAPDEVSIQESFAQPFTINDLSFPVTKWMYPCRPAVLRDISQGETPISPNPYPLLNREETLDPQGNIITINYATPNVRGVTNPCDVDQANIKIAGKWVCSQVIKTTTITREVPIREIIKVEGSNQFTFTSNNRKSFDIGANVFTASESYNCNLPEEGTSFNFPTPESKCYPSKISYGGESYELLDKESVALSDNVNVQYFAGGTIKRDKQELGGVYVFNIQNPLRLNVEGGLSFKHNTQANVKMSLINNLPANVVKIKVSQKVVRTNFNLIEKEIILNANEGGNSFDFDVDSTHLGVNEVAIQAFYPIDADAQVLLLSDKIIINMEILGEQPSIVRFVEVEKPIIVGKISLWQRFINFIKGLFG